MAVPRMAEPVPQHRAARTLEPLEALRSRRWQSKFCRGLAAVGGTEPAPHLRCAHLSPQRPAPLPMAQVQLSLMALCLLPDASFCSFRRISSILPSRRVAAGAQVQATIEETEKQRDAALELSPKRPCLCGDGARHPAACLPSLMNHAELHGGDTSVVAAAESLLLLLPPRAGSCGAAGLGPLLAPPAAVRARRLRPRCSR